VSWGARQFVHAPIAYSLRSKIESARYQCRRRCHCSYGSGEFREVTFDENAKVSSTHVIPIVIKDGLRERSVGK
jgi:hypothetical protein